MRVRIPVTFILSITLVLSCGAPVDAQDRSYVDQYMPLRSELIIADADGPAPQGGVKGRIETQLFIGERTEYRIRLEQQPPILVYGERKQAIPDNQEVWVRIAPETVTVWAAA